MSWKRTKLSYVLWMILVVMTCVVGYYATFGFCVQFGLQGTVILGIFAGVLLFGGLFSVLAFRLKQKWNGKAGEGKLLYLLLEILFFLAIAGCGIFLRLKYLSNAQPGALYQLSTIRLGETVPENFAGAEDVYVRILHGICFWFGNTPYFCIRFQLILNVLAGITWFFAVRKLAGRLPALVFAGFYFLHQFVAYGAVVLSAESLIFLVYGVGLLLVGTYLKNNKHAIWLSILTGIVIGVAGYFDVFCFTLLIMACSVWHLDDKKERWISMLLLFPSCALGFFASIFVKSLTAGKGFVAVLSHWGQCFRPKTILTTQLNDYFWFSFEGYWGTWLSVACVICLTIVIFAFLMKNGREKLSPWVGILVATLAMVVFQVNSIYYYLQTGDMANRVMDVPFDGTLLFLSCLFVLAGIGVEAIFADQEEVAKEQEIAEKAKEKEAEGDSKEPAQSVDDSSEEKTEDGELEVIEIDEKVLEKDDSEETEQVKAEPAEIDSEESKQEEFKFEEIKFEDNKPEENKPEKLEQEEVKIEQEEVKPEEIRFEVIKAEESKREELRQEEVKIEETKLEEPKLDEVKVEETKTDEVKTEAIKSEEIKTEEPKPERIKLEEPKPEEVKPEEPQLEESKIIKHEQEETKPEESEPAQSAKVKAEPKPKKSITERIKDFKDEHRQKLVYYIEHPAEMEGKNVIVRLLFERAKKKYETQKEMERVMNTLISLSEDHIVWTDGVRTKQSAPRPDSKIVTPPKVQPEAPKEETQAQPVNNETSEEEIKLETVRSEAVKAQEPKQEAVTPKTVKMEESKQEVVTPEAVKTEEPKQEAVIPEAVKVEELKQEPVNTEAVKVEEPIQETVTPEVADLEVAKAKEPETKIIKSEYSEEKETEAEEKKPEPLHNPLPEPKKHVATVMDYDYEVSDDDDYDFE